MEILGITVARGGSKRVPKKNIRSLDGHPLIYHTIRECLKSGMLTRYVVNTEDEEIGRIAASYGAEVVARPLELASDSAATIPVLRQTVSSMQKREGYFPDIIVQLNATSPLRQSKDIDRAVKLMIDTGCDAVKSVVRTMRIDRIHRLGPEKQVEFCWPYRETEMGITRTQDCPGYFVGNGAISAIWTRYIENGNSWKEVFYDNIEDFRGYEMPPERSVDIDTEQDFMFVEFMLNRLKGEPADTGPKNEPGQTIDYKNEKIDPGWKRRNPDLGRGRWC